jgi:methylated-DNA-[protein]-cysteine S-methyltransferase
VGQEYCLFETALGVCGLAWSAAGLTRVQLPERDPRTTERRLARVGRRAAAGEAPPGVAACIAGLRHHAAGERPDFAGVALDPLGVGAFDLRIYAALRAVPWGETTTYGALAAAVGEPGAGRAVGAAMARNPWPVVVPCHRVLEASGRLGGFSAHGGRVTKAALLRLEGTGPGGLPELPGLSG